MNTISSYLTYFFDKVKSQLCDRRNERDRVRVNRFAQLERTDVLVRRNMMEGVERVEVESDRSRLGADERNENRLVRDQQNVNQQPVGINEQPAEIIQISINNDNANQQIIHYPQLPQQQPPIMTHPKPSTYKLSFSQNHNIQQLQTSVQYQQQIQTIIEYQQQIDEYSQQINDLIKEFSHLEQQDNKRKKESWRNLYKRVSSSRGNNYQEELNFELKDGDKYQEYQLISGTNNNDNINTNPNTLPPQIINELYNQDITSTIQLKYTRQLIDYPYIDKQAYAEVRNLWAMGKRTPNHIVKELRLNFLQKLTARSFRTLSVGTWLNDEIINGYLEMIDNKCVQSGNRYRVLNSFFAQTTFAKSPQVIQRVLKRKNITPNNIIVIAINTGTHWLFAQITNGYIIIHDSIKKDVQKYTNEGSAIGKELENIRNFANMFYNKQHRIEMDNEYPQQLNGSDCGMFLLCGIKDIVRSYDQWSFDKDDINYKRFQVSLEIINQEIHGFGYQRY